MAGTFTTDYGESKCESCRIGFYSKPGASKCIKCPKGQTSIGYGAHECVTIDKEYHRHRDL
jgi:hypothetical protein